MVAPATRTPVVPTVCQDGLTQPDNPWTERTSNQALSWAFQDVVSSRAVDARVRFYTPAVGGSIPSAPTGVYRGSKTSCGNGHRRGWVRQRSRHGYLGALGRRNGCVHCSLIGCADFLP